VLWSGLSPAEQRTFKVLKLPGDGSKVPLLLGTTVGSKVVAAMNIFDWDNETDCDAKTSASANSCVQGCGWDKSSTLKPWEAMSRWLAEFGAKGNADRASKVFLLLNYFSTTNVFSRVELPTIIRSMLREENHLLDVMNAQNRERGGDETSESMKERYIMVHREQNYGVKVVSIRIARAAVDKSNMIIAPDGSMVKLEKGHTFPKLTCDTVIRFLHHVESSMRGDTNFKLCVRCFDGCDSHNFATVRAHRKGKCVQQDQKGCSRKKLIKAVDFTTKLLRGSKAIQKGSDVQKAPIDPKLETFLSNRLRDDVKKKGGRALMPLEDVNT
jgi:hypothetical protein